MAKAKYTKGKDGYFKTRVWDGTYDDVGRKKYVTIRSKKSSKDLENKVNEHNQKIKNREYVVCNDTSFCEYAEQWEVVYKASRAGNTKTFALPATSLEGAFEAPTLGTIAASSCSSPSTFRSG